MRTVEFAALLRSATLTASRRMPGKRRAAARPRATTLADLDHDVIDIILSHLDSHAHRCFASVLRACKQLEHLVTPLVLRPPRVCADVCVCLLRREAWPGPSERMARAATHAHLVCMRRWRTVVRHWTQEALIAAAGSGHWPCVDAILRSEYALRCPGRRPAVCVNPPVLIAAAGSGLLVTLLAYREWLDLWAPRVHLGSFLEQLAQRDDADALRAALLHPALGNTLSLATVVRMLRLWGAGNCLRRFDAPGAERLLLKDVTASRFEVVAAVAHGTSNRLTDTEIGALDTTDRHEALVAACSHGCAKGVAAALGIDAVACERAMKCALRGGNVECVRVLMTAGIQLGVDALDHTTAHREPDCIAFLRGCGVPWPDGFAVRVLAEASTSVAAYVLDSDCPRPEEFDPVCAALANPSVLWMLLRARNMPATSEALEAAVSNNHTDATRILLAHGVIARGNLYDVWLAGRDHSVECLQAMAAAGLPPPPHAMQQLIDRLCLTRENTDVIAMLRVLDKAGCAYNPEELEDTVIACRDRADTFLGRHYADRVYTYVLCKLGRARAGARSVTHTRAR